MSRLRSAHAAVVAAFLSSLAAAQHIEYRVLGQTGNNRVPPGDWPYLGRRIAQITQLSDGTNLISVRVPGSNATTHLLNGAGFQEVLRPTDPVPGFPEYSWGSLRGVPAWEQASGHTVFQMGTFAGLGPPQAPTLASARTLAGVTPNAISLASPNFQSWDSGNFGQLLHAVVNPQMPIIDSSRTFYTSSNIAPWMTRDGRIVVHSEGEWSAGLVENLAVRELLRRDQVVPGVGVCAQSRIHFELPDGRFLCSTWRGVPARWIYFILNPDGSGEPFLDWTTPLPDFVGNEINGITPFADAEGNIYFLVRFRMGASRSAIYTVRGGQLEILAKQGDPILGPNEELLITSADESFWCRSGGTFGFARTNAIFLGDRRTRVTLPVAIQGQQLRATDQWFSPTMVSARFNSSLEFEIGSDAHSLSNRLAADGSLTFVATDRNNSEYIIQARLVLPCPSDFNADGTTNLTDLQAFIAAFHTAAHPRGSRGADFNDDGFIDFFDYSDFMQAFESGCP